MGEIEPKQFTVVRELAAGIEAESIIQGREPHEIMANALELYLKIASDVRNGAELNLIIAKIDNLHPPIRGLSGIVNDALFGPPTRTHTIDTMKFFGGSKNPVPEIWELPKSD